LRLGAVLRPRTHRLLPRGGAARTVPAQTAVFVFSAAATRAGIVPPDLPSAMFRHSGSPIQAIASAQSYHALPSATRKTRNTSLGRASRLRAVIEGLGDARGKQTHRTQNADPVADLPTPPGLRSQSESGSGDLNPGPHGPEPCALAICATPRLVGYYTPVPTG
jgi:hypothetical protein